MNSFAAANPFENPLVLLAIAVVWVAANILMKRRQRGEASNRSDDNDQLPSTGAEGRPERAPDLQEVLGQLLGGEPSPQAPVPPAIPRYQRDGQPASDVSDEEQLDLEGAGISETREKFEETHPPMHQTAEPPRQRAALDMVSARDIEAGEGQEQAARRFAQLVEQGEYLAAILRANHGRCSRSGARTLSPWRDSRTVRRAFVASLILAPPKAFEN